MFDPVIGIDEVIDNQLLFAVAVHTHPVPAVTAIDPVETAAATDAEVASSTGAHGAAAPACVIVTVWPAIVSVPLRDAVAALAAAANCTVFDPVLCEPDVTDNQLALAAAVHSHVVPAVTVTLPVDAPAPIGRVAADKAGAHGAELAKLFEGSLVPRPPGPTAEMRA